MNNGTVYLVNNPDYARVLAEETGELGKYFCDKNGQVYRADYLASSTELMIREPVGAIRIVNQFSDAKQLLVIARESVAGVTLRPLEAMHRELCTKGWSAHELNNAVRACKRVTKSATPAVL